MKASKQIELIEQFCSSFNGSYLLLLPKKTQEMIKNLLLENGKGYESLISIANIALYMPLPEPVKYLNGPMTLTQHVKENRIVYIFGEFHGTTKTCEEKGIEIQNFLLQLVEQTPLFLDIFVEIDYIKRNELQLVNEYVPNYLQTIKDTFSRCLYGNVRTCPFKNLRIHYTDLRNYLADSAIRSYAKFWTMLSNFGYASITSLPDDVTNPLKKIFTSFESMREFIVKNSRHPLIKKQFNKIEDRNLAKKILDDYIDINLKISTDEGVLWKNYEEVKERYSKSLSFTEEDKKRLAILNWKMTEFFIFYMDLYLLGRLFKTYKGVSSQEKHPEQAKNIIIYVGENHALVYRKLFEELGYKKVAEGKKVDLRCLDIQSVPQPFFKEKLV